MSKEVVLDGARKGNNGSIGSLRANPGTSGGKDFGNDTTSGGKSNRDGEDSTRTHGQAEQSTGNDLATTTSNGENPGTIKSARTNRTSGGSGSGNRNPSDRGTKGSVDGEENTGTIPQKSLEGLKPKDVKPRKTASKIKEKNKDSGDITDAETLAVMLQSGFSLIAGVTRRSHWEIDEVEALTIAKPASTMIQKLSAAQKKKINQMAAPILLGSAIASVVLPRLMVDLAMAKGGKQNARNQYQVVSDSTKNVSQHSGKPTNHGQEHVTPSTTPVTPDVNQEIANLFGQLHNESIT